MFRRGRESIVPERYVVLAQRPHGFSSYNDEEWVIYHFPDRYRRSLERPLTRFVYYRPSEGAEPAEARHYFGHGVLGEIFQDSRESGKWYAPILTGQQRFRHLVPIRDADGVYYETGSIEKAPQFQFRAVRDIGEIEFQRIVIAGGVVSSSVFSPLVTTETVLTTGYVPGMKAPTEGLREIFEIPKGTGYVPSGKEPPSIYESPNLQERARQDHQDTLELIRRATARLGGSTFYNNYLDLYLRIGDRRFFIEAKSLNNPQRAVDRMRYGMGQLFDYRVRLAAEISGAAPVLAFGRMPPAETSWIGEILEGNGVAFVASEQNRIVALNALARSLPFAEAL
jgi:hypothetical protein